MTYQRTLRKYKRDKRKVSEAPEVTEKILKMFSNEENRALHDILLAELKVVLDAKTYAQVSRVITLVCENNRWKV